MLLIVEPSKPEKTKFFLRHHKSDEAPPGPVAVFFSRHPPAALSLPPLPAPPIRTPPLLPRSLLPPLARGLALDLRSFALESNLGNPPVRKLFLQGSIGELVGV